MRKISVNILILIIAFLTYSILWSIITVLRYETFHSGVFDLGVSSALLYSVFHQPFSFYMNGQPTLALNKMIYFIMTPFFNIYPDPRVLLIFQSFFIALTIFPIFGIAKHILKDETTAVLISLTFLFYYPMGGVNWFDFHYMALVPALFSFGFYFFVKEKYSLSTLFFVLAGISDYLVPLVIIIFSAIILVSGEKNRKFAFFLLIFSVLLFLIVTLYFGIQYLFTWTNYKSIDNYVISLQTNWQEKVIYFIYTLSPLLFIPLLDKKYIYLIIPFLGFAFFNNYYPFIDPMFFQYPSLITPFLFISLIYGLKFLKNKKLNMRNIRKIAVSIFTLNIALALVLMPWGPFNSDITHSYDFKNSLTVTNYDEVLDKMITLVPKGSSVLIQDNMPQMVIGYNWTLPDFLPINTFPEFIITDPYSYFFDHYSVFYPKYNNTMEQTFNRLLLTNEYGVYAEAYGMILLKLNYSGSPLIFYPYSVHLIQGKNHFNFIAPGSYSMINSSTNGTVLILSGNSTIIHEVVDPGMVIQIPEYFTNVTIETNINSYFIQVPQ